MIYVIENGTGRIVQRVDTIDDHAEHYARDGHSVLVTDQVVEAETNYVSGEQFIPIPEKPSEFHAWDWSAHVWTVSGAIVATAYIAKRRATYPAVGDQLDALWKGGEALEAMQQRILAVKAAYPKPQGEME